MALLKQMKLGQTLIEFYDDDVSKTNEDIRKNLIKIYDVINNIARKVEKRNVDTSKWFYKDSQIKSMKKDNKSLFI